MHSNLHKIFRQYFPQLQKEAQEKTNSFKLLGSDIAVVPTAYQQRQSPSHWIAPVPLIETSITEIKKDGWGIERKVKVKGWKHDWSEWSTSLTEVEAIWKEFDEIIESKQIGNGSKLIEALKASRTMKCPICGKQTIVKEQLQTRSADEAPTEILKCLSCGHTWRAKD